MKALRKTFLLGLTLSLLFTSCKKESTSPSTDSKGGAGYIAPTLAKDSLVKIPEQIITKSNSDFSLLNLILGESFINTFSNSLAGWFVYDNNTMSGWSNNKNSDGSTTYSWKYFTYSYNLIYFNSSGESWWKYQYDSASYHWTWCYILDKGTSGEVDWYTQKYFKDTQKVALKDSYSKSGTTINSTFSSYNDSEIEASRYEATSNADRSGTMNIYELVSTSLVKKYSYTWDKNGAGVWITYNDDGSQSGTGSF